MNLNIQIQGKGFPILCLHGHPGSGRSLSVFTNFLSQRFQTLAPDLRGYGNSRPCGNFQMSDHLTDLTALLDQFKIDRCLLLGWSFGGILAIELALRYSQRFSGLILIASAARPRSYHPPVSWQDLFYTGVAGILNSIKPGWQWNIDIFGRRSLFRYLLQQQTPLAYQYLASEGTPAYLQTSGAAKAALSQALKAGYNRLEDLGKIDFPCLVLAGAEDRHITAQSSEETAQHLKHCHWQCYPNTAHLFPWEIPSQVLTDIDCWLDAHPEVVNTK
ncbi:MAG: alpha/beta fold hydrolase [Xenococcaceae cyanobacterium]